MPDGFGVRLEGRVAVVTGASRGVGRGIALALGDAGATVYVTGRTVEDRGDPPRSIARTAAEVTSRGGRGVAVRVDHGEDDAVRALFDRVARDEGRLDVLVNNAFSLPDEGMWGQPFWAQPIALWDRMHGVGLRSHYVASVLAAPLLLETARREGGALVANVSSFAGAGFQLNVAYGVGKAAVDRLAADMAHDLGPHGVACVSLWPGIVRTEWILAHEGALPFSTRVSESPELTGRVVAALAADPATIERTGQVVVVAEEARARGLRDVDGAQPPSLRELGRKRGRDTTDDGGPDR